jgi:hypothetical protein
MSDEMQLLHEFEAEVPPLSERARSRIHAYATGNRYSGRALLSRISIAASPRKRVHWQAVFALGLAAVAAAIAAVATSGGASPPSNAQSVATGVNSVVSQVQNSFGGGGQIVSASMNGSALAVELQAPNEPSLTSGAFEAQILAHAVGDWMTANGQGSVNSVVYLNSQGAALPGSQTSDSVASSPSVTPLASGACNTAAQAAQSEEATLSGGSLTVETVKSLPYMNGTCVITFQTSDPNGFAGDAPLLVGKLVNTLGDPNERPYLVQVDDAAGTPQFLASYVPGVGGQAYIKPGLSNAFSAGSQIHSGG